MLKSAFNGKRFNHFTRKPEKAEIGTCSKTEQLLFRISKTGQSFRKRKNNQNKEGQKKYFEVDKMKFLISSDKSPTRIINFNYSINAIYTDF